MAKKKLVSVKYSFSGWSLKTWFDKNKLWFIKEKETLKALVSAIAGYISFSYPDSALIAILFGAGGAYLSKLVVDSLDYFLSENPR